MILLTIGTQLPFDRLVRAVDLLANGSSEEIFGQIGKNASYLPESFEYCFDMAPAEFDIKFKAARVIVSHAGIGTILTARRHRKPIIVMPRQAKFGEHRNDHQLATCTQLGARPGIHVAHDAEDLARIIGMAELALPDPIDESPQRQGLLDAIRKFTVEQQRSSQPTETRG